MVTLNRKFIYCNFSPVERVKENALRFSAIKLLINRPNDPKRNVPGDKLRNYNKYAITKTALHKKTLRSQKYIN